MTTTEQIQDPPTAKLTWGQWLYHKDNGTGWLDGGNRWAKIDGVKHLVRVDSF